MHQNNIQIYQHLHNFHEVKESNIEKVSFVVIITMLTMVAEIIFGWIFNSMALLSDGWHMATHASALGITLFTYFIAKKHRNDSRYSFGTWKVEILGAYTSAILLGIVGLFVIYSSLGRIFNPVNIHYNQALIVAFIGLGVNIFCAVILNSGRDASHRHNHDEHGHTHHITHDLSIRSAYLHVMADVLTSVFAILALLGAKLFHLSILDPLMGVLSSILIFRWSFGLLKETSAILLDKDKNQDLINEIKAIIENDDDTVISDLHLWKVGQNKYSCILSLVASKPRNINEYKESLKKVHELAHINIEIVKCK
ncbi:MAG: CDF family Co(II)/Ni(II) efflux transporter DmeF [candidate division Zixibacteria bacterium]|nr:CDF family Co(II)/Ni(II) efflux transporter DmeF [candidate division Zixibacteria bacterium]